MKFYSFKSLFFFFSVILLSSCLGTEDAVDTSDDASFVSLTFAANDSIPNIEDAFFTLEGNIIQNVDSLPFQTRIDSVNPTFRFASTYVALINDSTTLTGTDTLDFSLPVKLRNFASNGIAYKDYIIKVNVHQVDPELYIYKKLYDITESQSIVNQKTIIFNDKMYYYRNNSTNYFLNTSTNGSAWSASISVTGLPANASLNDMLTFSGKLYLSSGGKIYSSADGSIWSIADSFSANYFESILFSLNGEMWLIAKIDQKYHFARCTEGVAPEIKGELPAKFPVNDFSALSFTSRSGKAKAIVVGGKDLDGTILKTNWSTENGIYWIDFSDKDFNAKSTSLDTLAMGSSIIAYDDKLLLFGARNNTGSVLENHFKESIDEGFTWQTPDSSSNYLPESYPARSYQSVVVDNSNRIFIIGGKAGTIVLSDVWTGKLNRKGFIK